MLQYGGQPTLEFDTFDATLDEFYSKIEGQRADLARADAEKAAVSRLSKIKDDQGGRADALLRQAEEHELKAQLITYNREAVDASIDAVNQALATGMDWSDLEALIRDERKAGNPVAGLIASLQLSANSATLLLVNSLDAEEGDEGANTRPATKVSVDLGLTAHANATSYFEQRRRALAKHAKTLSANQAALAAAEKKAEQQLKQVRSQPAALQALRKPLWFERFSWFITSENYLVLSGRDAQQNELIVKRYMRRGDVYVHADLHGASTTIVKNHSPDAPIPPLTLTQAGCACVCRSRAWDSKIVTSAWWVYSHQVSKTAPTGEYLPTGSFMIRGKKNFLPPQPLVMGFGFMFRLEEGSIAAHRGERSVRGQDQDQDGDAASTSFSAARTATASSSMLGQAAESITTMGDGGEDAVSIDDDGDDDEDGGECEDGKAGSQSGAASAAAATASRATSSGPTPLELFMEGTYGMPQPPSSTRSTATAAYDRYGLAAAAGPGEAYEDEGEAEAAGARRGDGGAGGRRHLSTKERADLKKTGGRPAGGGAPNGGADDLEYTIVYADGPGGGGGKAAGAGTSGSGAVGPAAGGAKGGKPAAGASSAAGAGAAPAGAAPVPAPAGKGQGSASSGPQGPSAQQPKQGAAAAPNKGGGKGGGVGGGGMQSKAAAAAAAAVAAAAAAAAAAAGPGNRGKKAKQAKLKDKYADQDEEERALALAFLGSAGTKKTRADRRAERKERKEGVRQVDRAALGGDEDARLEAISRATGKQFAGRKQQQLAAVQEDASSSGEDTDGDEQVNGGPAQAEQLEASELGGPGAVTDAAAAATPDDGGQDGAAQEAADEDKVPGGAAGTAGGQGADDDEEEEGAGGAEAEAEAGRGQELSVLDSLTGQPRAEDLLLFAVPVCGPYSALQNYKIKVKVTPGTVKKGKAARQAIELLTRGSDLPPREREVLRALPEMDAINALVGPGVKLSMPGLQKLKAGEKASKKAKAQARVGAAGGGAE